MRKQAGPLRYHSGRLGPAVTLTTFTPTMPWAKVLISKGSVTFTPHDNDIRFTTAKFEAVERCLEVIGETLEELIEGAEPSCLLPDSSSS